MAQVYFEIPDGFACDKPDAEKMPLAERLAAEVGVRVDELFFQPDDDDSGLVYLFGAVPDTSECANYQQDPAPLGLVRLLAAMDGPISYGVAPLPQRFLAALHDIIGDVEWNYTVTCPKAGREYYNYDIHLDPKGLWGYWTTYDLDEETNEYHSTESGKMEVSGETTSRSLRKGAKEREAQTARRRSADTVDDEAESEPTYRYELRVRFPGDCLNDTYFASGRESPETWIRQHFKYYQIVETPDGWSKDDDETDEDVYGVTTSKEAAHAFAEELNCYPGMVVDVNAVRQLTPAEEDVAAILKALGAD